MTWRTTPVELQDIVWDFCGDLRNVDTRHKKFNLLELRIWNMITGVGHLVPSRLLDLRAICNGVLKQYLRLAYRKAHLETAYESPLKLEELSNRIASPTTAQPLGLW